MSIKNLIATYLENGTFLEGIVFVKNVFKWALLSKYSVKIMLGYYIEKAAYANSRKCARTTLKLSV